MDYYDASEEYLYPPSGDEQPVVRSIKAPQITCGYASDTGYDEDSGDEVYYRAPSPRPPTIDIMKTFKRFAVELTIKGREKTVVSTPERWFDLDDQDVSACDNFGIHTGRKNGITAIDCHSQFGIDMDELRTLRITTPSNKCCYLFEYEESLESIYIASSGISILNDKRCVFFGKSYKNTTHPIVRMPEHLRTALVTMHNKAEAAVEVIPRWYDLINILPTCSYDDERLLMNVVYAFQNAFLPKLVSIKTVQKLLMERYGYYHERLLIAKFNEPSKPYTFKRLQNAIAELYPHEYTMWRDKYSPQGVQQRARVKTLSEAIRYKSGALTKVIDIKTAVGNSVTSSDLAVIDSRIVTTRKLICKTCKNRHLKGCCAAYGSKNYSSCVYAQNAEMI